MLNFHIQAKLPPLQPAHKINKTRSFLAGRQIRKVQKDAKKGRRKAIKAGITRRNMPWKIKQVSRKKADLRNSILIEGLPGMGNVGKIAVDFMIDAFKADRIYEITSNELPHCVFVNEENIVELPSISIFAKKVNNQNFLFLAGDIQPISEKSCYEFCHALLDTFEKKNLKEIITLGGIALPRVPEKPVVYATANSKGILEKHRHKMIKTNLHGTVGPIIGVSGLLTGLAGQRKIPAITFLAETFAHPNYLGMRGARNILQVLKENLKLDMELKELDNEISNVDRETTKRLKKVENLNKAVKRAGDFTSFQHDLSGLEEEKTYIG